MVHDPIISSAEGKWDSADSLLRTEAKQDELEKMKVLGLLYDPFKDTVFVPIELRVNQTKRKGCGSQHQ